MAKEWRAGMWMACAPGLVGLGAMRAQAQDQMGILLPAQATNSASFEHFRRIDSPRTEGFITYTFQNELSDQFDKRTLQFQVINEFLRNQDLGEMRERFGNSAGKKIERSALRTVAHYLEASPIGNSLQNEPWKERLFKIAADAVTEETHTIDGQLGDDDPHLNYDYDSAVVRKPVWKERVNFFLRPFSMHPNAGVGLKLDAVRAQIKAYHDEVKFSAVVPITHHWNFYTSARLPNFDAREASFNFGFQHPLKFPNDVSGLIQYGISFRNHDVEDDFGNTTKHPFTPHAFFALALDF